MRTQAADSSGTAGSLQRPNSSSSTLEWLVQEQLQHHAHNRATGSTVGTETGAFCTKNAGSIPAAGPRTCSTPAACGQDSSQQPEMHVRQQASQQQQTTFQRRLPAMNMPQPPQQQQHKSPADPHNLLHRPNPQAQRSQLSSTHQQRMQQQQHPESSVSKDSDKPDDSRSTAALSGQVEVCWAHLYVYHATRNAAQHHCRLLSILLSSGSIPDVSAASMPQQDGRLGDTYAAVPARHPLQPIVLAAIVSHAVHVRSLGIAQCPTAPLLLLLPTICRIWSSAMSNWTKTAHISTSSTCTHCHQQQQCQVLPLAAAWEHPPQPCDQQEAGLQAAAAAVWGRVTPSPCHQSSSGGWLS